MVTDAAGAARLRDLLPVMRVTHERDPVPLTPLESGSRTSTVAAKLLSKSGGGGGAGAGGPQSRAREKEEERAEEEAWEASDRSRASSTAGTGTELAKEKGVGRAGEGRNAATTSSGDGGLEEGGAGGEDGGERWRVESSPVYAHFGSQVGSGEVDRPTGLIPAAELR